MLKIYFSSTVLDSLDSNLRISPATLNHHCYCNSFIVSLLEGTDCNLRAKSCWGWHEGNSPSPQSCLQPQPHCDTVLSPRAGAHSPSCSLSTCLEGFQCPSSASHPACAPLRTARGSRVEVDETALHSLWGSASPLQCRSDRDHSSANFWACPGTAEEAWQTLVKLSVYSHSTEQGRVKPNPQSAWWVGDQRNIYWTAEEKPVTADKHAPYFPIGLVHNTLNIRETSLPPPPLWTNLLLAFRSTPRSTSSQGLAVHSAPASPPDAHTWALWPSQCRAQSHWRSSFHTTEHTRSRREQAGLCASVHPACCFACFWMGNVKTLFVKPTATLSSWLKKETKKHQLACADWPSVNSQWTKAWERTKKTGTDSFCPSVCHCTHPLLKRRSLKTSENENTPKNTCTSNKEPHNSGPPIPKTSFQEN